jgi:hypothetical protein
LSSLDRSIDNLIVRDWNPDRPRLIKTVREARYTFAAPPKKRA